MNMGLFPWFVIPGRGSNSEFQQEHVKFLHASYLNQSRCRDCQTDWVVLKPFGAGPKLGRGAHEQVSHSLSLGQGSSQDARHTFSRTCPILGKRAWASHRHILFSRRVWHAALCKVRRVQLRGFFCLRRITRKHHSRTNQVAFVG